VQELRFLVESANLDNPAYLASIRRLPAANGRPVGVCKACQARIETAPPRPARSGVFTAFGILGVGWFMTAMLAPRA
jgi:hypothetical protein